MNPGSCRVMKPRKTENPPFTMDEDKYEQDQSPGQNLQEAPEPPHPSISKFSSFLHAFLYINVICKHSRTFNTTVDHLITISYDASILPVCRVADVTSCVLQCVVSACCSWACGLSSSQPEFYHETPGA